MRMMLTVRFPHEPFNTLVRNGEIGPLMDRVLQDLQPEAVYFTEIDGTRAAVLIVDIADPSRVPTFAEPFFLGFEADCDFSIVMSGEELAAAGLDELGRKWG